MHYLILLMSCWFAVSLQAQTKKPSWYTREITVTTENDAYLLQKKDAYYTNGFFFTHRTAKQKNGQKRIVSFEIGQMIFTPLIRKTMGPEDIDRPYCGYLYLQSGQTRFLQKDAVLQFSVSLGQVGQASFGEDVQNSYHHILKYAPFLGWQYQVRNASGADLGISYARTMAEDSSWIKLVPIVQTNLGMNFTNARLGTYLCLGNFDKNRNSALWNARVQTEAGDYKKQEFFFYWYPQLIWEVYNATVQGGLGQKGSGAVLGEIEPWLFQQALGICYAGRRCTGKLAYVYQSREAKAQTRIQEYASIQVSYRLH